MARKDPHTEPGARHRRSTGQASTSSFGRRAAQLAHRDHDPARLDPAHHSGPRGAEEHRIRPRQASQRLRRPAEADRPTPTAPTPPSNTHHPCRFALATIRTHRPGSFLHRDHRIAQPRRPQPPHQQPHHTPTNPARARQRECTLLRRAAQPPGGELVLPERLPVRGRHRFTTRQPPTYRQHLPLPTDVLNHNRPAAPTDQRRIKLGRPGRCVGPRWREFVLITQVHLRDQEFSDGDVENP